MVLLLIVVVDDYNDVEYIVIVVCSDNIVFSSFSFLLLVVLLNDVHYILVGFSCVEFITLVHSAIGVDYIAIDIIMLIVIDNVVIGICIVIGVLLLIDVHLLIVLFLVDADADCIVLYCCRVYYYCFLY